MQIIHYLVLCMCMVEKALLYRHWIPNDVSTPYRTLSEGWRRQSNTFPEYTPTCHQKHGSHPLYMIWCYPIIDDGPERSNRRKINQAFERGPIRANVALTYRWANRLAQNQMFVPFEGNLPYYPEEGLGRTEDVYTPVETACGEVDIDPHEFAKIKDVYTTFNDNGCGVLKLLGAKSGHFAFSYSGPLKEKYGIKAYLNYQINLVYPGAKVTILTDHLIDGADQQGTDPWLFSKQRRLVRTGKDYMKSFKDDLPHENAYPPKFDMLI
uniref:Uncharacterized protein n=1 Tax=Babesia bovis TaxID=5865 RepID=S6B1B6_BABBO|nr:conserved hypothetical protein [Babesia bovis]